MSKKEIQDVIQANIELHSKMSGDYNTCEPQYRPENLNRVEDALKEAIDQCGAKKMLDLGCGTGFLIDMGKKYVEEITGVDVTQAMMDRVDKSGSCKIELINHDTGTVPLKEGYYDIATAHSFLHHLYDINPTIQTAAKALKKGGIFFSELDPNFYFWEAIGKLDREGQYSPTVKREIEMTTYKDEDIEAEFGVQKEVFNTAEYGKNIKGGFKEEELVTSLKDAGFSEVKINYHWYIGQAGLINNDNFGGTRDERIKNSNQFDEVLADLVPLSRHLYKYIGFVAIK